VYPGYGQTETISGAWTFSEQVVVSEVGTSSNPSLLIASTVPLLEFKDTDAAADGQRWQFFASGVNLILRLINDASSSAKNIFSIVRSTTTLSSITYGDSTDNPTHTFNGQIIETTNILARTSTAYTNGAGALTGTLTNSPVTGNPTKWIPVNDNGTTRYIPAW